MAVTVEFSPGFVLDREFTQAVRMALREGDSSSVTISFAHWWLKGVQWAKPPKPYGDT